MTTTIKVSMALRDRLKAQASRDGQSLGSHLARLADAEDRRVRLAALQAAVASSPPDARASHAVESREWEDAEFTDASA